MHISSRSDATELMIMRQCVKNVSANLARIMRRDRVHKANTAVNLVGIRMIQLKVAARLWRVSSRGGHCSLRLTAGFKLCN